MNPEILNNVRDTVNNLPIGNDSSVIRNRYLKNPRLSTSQAVKANDETPNYIKDDGIQKILGKTVLSLFGGADITPLQSKEVESLLIVDANPFVSKPSITESLSDPVNKNGLLHERLGLFILGYSPMLYATQNNGNDYDSPYRIFNLAIRHDDNYQSKIHLYAGNHSNSESGPEELEQKEDELLHFVYDNVLKAFANAWKGPREKKVPVVNLGDIGLSTLILLRLRYCLHATILEFTELEEQKFFHIRIRKEDGTEASLYYASCLFGGNENDKALLEKVSNYTQNQLGGISSVLIKGFPTFFEGKVLGDEARVAQDVRGFVEKCTKISPEALPCVVSTVQGDKLPNVFASSDTVSTNSFTSQIQGGEVEQIYICPGTQLLGLTESNHIKAQLEKMKADEVSNASILNQNYK